MKVNTFQLSIFNRRLGPDIHFNAWMDITKFSKYLCHKLHTLGKNCPYSELFWFVFSLIWIEYVEILLNCPYSVRMRGDTNQNNSEHGLFLRINTFLGFLTYIKHIVLNTGYRPRISNTKYKVMLFMRIIIQSRIPMISKYSLLHCTHFKISGKKSFIITTQKENKE